MHVVIISFFVLLATEVICRHVDEKFDELTKDPASQWARATIDRINALNEEKKHGSKVTSRAKVASPLKWEDVHGEGSSEYHGD